MMKPELNSEAAVKQFLNYESVSKPGDMVSFDCQPMGFVIFFSGCHILSSILTLFVTIVAIRKFLTSSKEMKIIKIFKYLCILALILCTIAIGPGFGAILFWYQNCDMNNDQDPTGWIYVFGVACVVCYSFTLTLFYAIFAFRLHRSVSKTAYQFSKQQARFLMILFCIQLITNLIGTSAYAINGEFAIRIISLQIVCQISYTIAIRVLWVFVFVVSVIYSNFYWF